VNSESINQGHLPSVSIVVTSFNQRQILQRLLPQLDSEEYPCEKLEIIVVDDGSSNGSREWLATLESARLRVILRERDRGRSAVRNDGIRIAQNDVIIMLDGDHTIDKGLILSHAKRHAECECVVVGQSQYSGHWRFRALFRYLNTRGAHKLRSGSPLPGRYFVTRNCSVPKTLLQRVGLFNEIFAWGGEDLDFGVRLEGAGIAIVYEPRAKAWHHHHRSLNDLLRNLRIYGEKSVPRLVEKHPQLYRELNLHQLEKPWIRFLMQAPFYHFIRLMTTLLLPLHVPPIVFDYLHLRQYGAGFLHSQEKRGK